MRLQCAKISVALGVFLGRDVAQLLEQRHVHVRLDVARDARVPVPVPGAADVGGLVDQPDALHAELAQPRSGEQSAETGADDRDVDLVGQRCAREIRIAPGIVGESRKRPGDFDVLRDAVRAQASIPFKGVFLPQSVYVECHLGGASTLRQLMLLPGILVHGHQSGKDSTCTDGDC